MCGNFASREGESPREPRIYLVPESYIHLIEPGRAELPLRPIISGAQDSLSRRNAVKTDPGPQQHSPCKPLRNMQTHRQPTMVGRVSLSRQLSRRSAAKTEVGRRRIRARHSEVWNFFLSRRSFAETDGPWTLDAWILISAFRAQLIGHLPSCHLPSPLPRLAPTYHGTRNTQHAPLPHSANLRVPSCPSWLKFPFPAFSPTNCARASLASQFTIPNVK